MVMISSISIDNLVKKTAEIKLASDKTSYERITVELTEEETAEVIQLVSEIIATRLRMPAIVKKLEERKASFDELLPKAYETPGDNTPVPSTIKTPTGMASFTPDGYKPDNPKPGIICPIHNVGHDPQQDCPMCAEIASGFNERARGMKPSDNIDPPF